MECADQQNITKHLTDFAIWKRQSGPCPDMSSGSVSKKCYGWFEVNSCALACHRSKLKSNYETIIYLAESEIIRLFTITDTATVI